MFSQSSSFPGFLEKSPFIHLSILETLTFSSNVPQAVVELRAFNRRVKCKNVKRLQYPHTSSLNKFMCFSTSGGSESRSHVNGCIQGREDLREISCSFCFG